MQTIDIARRAGTNLKQAKGRTFLTSLAIAVGACTITLAMAAGAGGRDYVSKQLIDRGIGTKDYIQIYQNSDEGHSSQEYTVKPFVENQSTQLESNDEEPSKAFTPDKIAQLKAITGVEDLRYNFDISGLYVNKTDSDQRFVAPILSGQTSITPLNVTTGISEEDLKSGQIIISQDYVKAFGFNDPSQALNQKIQLTYLDLNQQRITKDLVIHGIYSNPDSRDDFLIAYADAEEIATNQLGPIDQLSFRQATALVSESANTDAVVRDIENLGFYAASNRQMQAAFLDSVNIVQWGLVGFGALALLASIFGIINTQYISVLERTQQIGLMRAVGASRKDIASLFRYEAAWIGFLGATIGILVAIICKLAEPLVKKLLQMPDDFIILIFEPLTILAIIAILVLVAVTAGYFPARRAAKLDPIEALRTE